MKLTLTLPEVEQFVRKALGLSDWTPLDLEVVTDTHVLALALRQALNQFPDYRTSQKIAAIKRFRELAPQRRDPDRSMFVSVVSLIDAKFAIENPDAAFLNIGRCGRIQ